MSVKDWFQRTGRRRAILTRDGLKDYLVRYYLTLPPVMPDGSPGFDERGVPKKGIVWRDNRAGVSVFLHHFKESDDAGELHSHPWEWAYSLILSGGYSEERRVTRHVEYDCTYTIGAQTLGKHGTSIQHEVVRKTFGPGSINKLTKDTFHRVDLLDPSKGCWSLFLAGPKYSSWGFWNRETGFFTPWREFVDRKKKPQDGAGMVTPANTMMGLAKAALTPAEEKDSEELNAALRSAVRLRRTFFLEDFLK
jgi:hypothetical protein